MHLLPTSFALTGTVAVVGGGPDATHAVRLLRTTGANVRWYSSDVDVAEEVLLASPPPGWPELSFADPLSGPFGDVVAIVSADDGPLDDAVAARARARNVPVHVIDRPEISTIQLFTPAKRPSPWTIGPIGRDWKGFRARQGAPAERAAS
jgi:uroporphyrin-III C-methyltransferase/precorrin-2 dehydrogenase/sirohydrochlorin ferrochelatase